MMRKGENRGGGREGKKVTDYNRGGGVEEKEEERKEEEEGE